MTKKYDAIVFIGRFQPFHNAHLSIIQSAAELAEKVIALTNTESKIIYKPLPQDDPQQRQPNIDKAKELLSIS